ncbi:MAG: hypothetical protein ABJN65_11695 [Parasphingorhabdus sp.]
MKFEFTLRIIFGRIGGSGPIDDLIFLSEWRKYADRSDVILDGKIKDPPSVR